MTATTNTALIVDDEEDLCLLMQMTLKKMNIASEVAYNIEQAKQQLQTHQFDFCLTDLNLPDGSGLSLVEYINNDFPDIPVAVITAYGSMDIAIEALKQGAFDFVNKPLELPRLRQLIANALKVEPLSQQTKQADDPSTQKLLGQSEVINQLRHTIKKLARSQAPVFIQGQSGTGKEVVASLIHELSPRTTGNFVPVNCGAIPSELMESEFFGHKKGSFTGAVTDKDGLFQLANQGTLFLDEVADLPLNMQVKLLRAIQEKKIRPIGGQKEIAVDIRLLSATHKNLAQLVDQGKFRQDLYYRINVIEMNLPTLNERGNDIILLAEHFIKAIAKEWELDTPPTLSAPAQQTLLKHHYQGNVRELRNMLERAITLCDGHEILNAHLPQQPSIENVNTNTEHSQQVSTITNVIEAQATVDTTVLNSHSANNSIDSLINNEKLTSAELINSLDDSLPTLINTLRPEEQNNETDKDQRHSEPVSVTNLPEGGIDAYLELEERRLMIEALNLCQWNRTKAANMLNTSFRSFRYKMKKLDIHEYRERHD